MPSAIDEASANAGHPRAILSGHRIYGIRPRCPDRAGVHQVHQSFDDDPGFPGDIQIHLRARCGSAEDAERLLAEVGDPIEALLGRHLFSRNGDPLEAIIGTLLRERHATLSIAESCTGGMVGERITSIAGSSDYFVGGFVTYTDGMKTDLLAWTPLIAQHTAVSKEVARAMAEGARSRTGSTFAISITGEAGPESSTGAPVGTIFVGFAGPDGPPEALRFAMPGDRPRIRGFATQASLDLLRRRLLKLD